MDRDDVVRRDLVELRQRGDRPAGLVHVGVRPDQHELGAANAQTTLDHITATVLVTTKAGTQTSSQLVSDEVADVVPGAGVLRSRIPETDDEPGALSVVSHRCFLCGAWGEDQSSVGASSVVSAAASAPPSAAAASPSAVSSSAGSSAAWATVTLTTSSSGSLSSVEPLGSSSALAWIWVPASAPSTETSMCSGMWVASASSEMVWFSM